MSATQQDLSRENLASALTAWADVVACATPLSLTLGASLGWLGVLWREGHDHLPLTVVHDLGQVLLQGREFRFASSRGLGRWSGPERALRLAYEDRFVGRWVLDRTVLEAHITVAGIPAEQRDAAVTHAIALALSRPLQPLGELHRGNAAHLRAIAAHMVQSIEDDPGSRRDKLGADWHTWALECLSAALEALPRAQLFRPEDIWELSHFTTVSSDSARLALRTINNLTARVGGVSSSALSRLKKNAREVPVEAEESESYPAGGFDAIATRGSFENLVRSEVSYVGEGTVDTRGVDLFDLRFAESELLFYTRDESPLLDARREVTVVIDRPAQQRHKHLELETQTLVLSGVLGLVLQSDLVTAFGPMGARCKFVWLAARDEDLTVADEELGLFSTLLESEIAHRRAEIAVLRSWQEITEGLCVVLSPLAHSARVNATAWVRVDGVSWTYGEEIFSLTDAPTALRALCDHLLVAITRGARGRKNFSGRAPKQ